MGWMLTGLVGCGVPDPGGVNLTLDEDATGGGGGTATTGGASAGTGGPAPGVVGFEEHDIEIPGDLHVQGLTLRAKLFVPQFAAPVGPLSAMMVLHGSGGLFRMPSDEDVALGRTCSLEMEEQFARWSQRLAELGHVVLMPSSYCSRGFCDYNDDSDRIPPEFDDDRERLLGRLYDVDAAGRYLCDLPDVDCERMGLLGFSNGGSAVLVSLHWQLDLALDLFAQSDGPDLDVPVLPVPPGGPSYALGVAYYPGCGLDGLVPFGIDPDDPIEEMYFPSTELHIEHGTDDSLIDDCSTAHGEGRRQIQSARVAMELGVADRFHHTPHEGAGHGFDNAEDGDPAADVAARDTGLMTTLEHLATRLAP